VEGGRYTGGGGGWRGAGGGYTGGEGGGAVPGAHWGRGQRVTVRSASDKERQWGLVKGDWQRTGERGKGWDGASAWPVSAWGSSAIHSSNWNVNSSSGGGSKRALV